MMPLLFECTGEAHIDILYPGDVTVFPRGLLHFELNVGKRTALYISALNSQNPGVLVRLYSGIGGLLLVGCVRVVYYMLQLDLFLLS